MLKLPITIVFMFVLFTTEAVNPLCSVKKTENYCVCKRVTSENEDLVVTEADCARIDLEYVPNQDQLTEDLNLLDLSYNKIGELDENKNKLASITLKTLLLSYNFIAVISASFFKDVPNLRTLDLSHNSLTSLDDETVFQNCPELSHLDLSFNKIKTLHADILTPLVHLQYLDLSYNNHSLGDSLTQSNLKMNPNITTLMLDNLNLTNFRNLFFSNYTSLKHLSLADNHFQEVPRVPYSVEYLDLSGSDISVLQAKHLSYHSLKTLKLERMKKLESIHPYAFYNLQGLEELSIRNCYKLQEFNELIFGVLHKNMILGLRKLDLSGNSLQELNSTYRYLFRILDEVDLRDNPWRCDCELLWVQEFDNLRRSDYVRCSYPSRLNSKKLIDVTEKDVPMCYAQQFRKTHKILISILLVLIIVLSGLVGYLMYYAPGWYIPKSIRVGPQSPYNPARTEEH